MKLFWLFCLVLELCFTVGFCSLLLKKDSLNSGFGLGFGLSIGSSFPNEIELLPPGGAWGVYTGLKVFLLLNSVSWFCFGFIGLLIGSSYPKEIELLPPGGAWGA